MKWKDDAGWIVLLAAMWILAFYVCEWADVTLPTLP